MVSVLVFLVYLVCSVHCARGHGDRVEGNGEGPSTVLNELVLLTTHHRPPSTHSKMIPISEARDLSLPRGMPSFSFSWVISRTSQKAMVKDS